MKPAHKQKGANPMLWAMLCNAAIGITFFICVTACVAVAAIHFDEFSLLWWYVPGAFIGYRYSKEKEE